MSKSTTARPVIRRLLTTQRLAHLPPTFLLPSLFASQPQTTSFSTTPSPQYPRDHNRNRGVSPMRRTGPRQPLSVSKLPLPEPVRDPALLNKVEVDSNHGLYNFFYSKDKTFLPPAEMEKHGRAWAVADLRGKSWEDLHALWWVCCKERNRIATAYQEAKRAKKGDLDVRRERSEVVKETQRNIKHCLSERYYSWMEAQALSKNDPEINLSGEGQLYTPAEFFEEDFYQEEDANEGEEIIEGEGIEVGRSQKSQTSSPQAKAGTGLSQQGKETTI